MFAVFRPVRKAMYGMTMAVSMLGLAACVPATTGQTGRSINPNAEVQVALLVPGGSGEAADDVLAQNLENAARLAVSDLDGVKIDLRVYNTAGNPEIAASVAKQAVDEGAKIILGPVYAQNANAAGVAVASRNVNVLSFSNNTEIAGGNVFVLGPTFQNTAKRLLSFANARGRGSVMIVSDGNVAGQAGASAIRSAAAAAGTAVVGEVTYEFSQNGIVQAIPEIASTARDSGANSLFFTADTAGALPLVTQLLPENRISAPQFQFMGLTRWDIPATTLALPGVQGGWFALPDPQLGNAYAARFQAAFGQAPHPISGLAYDGIAAIGALIKQGNSNALTTVGLTQPSGFAGVSGVFRLRADGTNERGLAVAEIKENQVIVIDPAPRSFGGAGS
ncbi:ABC transporter substrate-binding protein [Actibacterium mucosum KCTC 23349]|uniref:ABC transporter substrate-binding protein n=1 Tax=Actibacterium mucosum KCTC 23349 TaxID=1454373 RepID=A0A037ZHG4_9RHOB|nr:penicillin-binding protein activator [Actibacterium mucosum]KAJ55064.1 ABC transporter substrate-binding protein [Actibacterium mucosum KCTC 23349]